VTESVTKEQLITKGQFACRIAAQIDISHNVPLLGDLSLVSIIME